MLTSPFRILPTLIIAFGALAAAPAAQFDFENLTATYRGGGQRPGAYTSVSQTVGGLTMTVTRTQGTGFDVYGNGDAPQPGDALAGTRWLDGFNVSPERPFVLDFDATLSSFSLFMGQFTAAPSRNAFLRAYSGVGGTGSLLMESAGTIPISGTNTGISSTLAGVQLTVTGSGIRSVVATMNGSFRNGFIDNGAATVAPVPEPASLVALGLGALAIVQRRRA